jgi:hypothetical protein
MSAPSIDKMQVTVDEFARYEDAERAVDYLADHKFAVEHLTIVGCDLRFIEKVFGRVTWARVIASGLGAGLWLGLLIGLLLSIWTDSASRAISVILGSAAYGAIFIAIFAAIAYALMGGRHDYVSRSQVVAGRYELVAEPAWAERAREALAALH